MPVPVPQHVQSSVTTTPRIQPQASGRSPTVLRATSPGTPNRFPQPMNTGPSISVSPSTRHSDNGIRRSTSTTRGQRRFEHYTAE